MTDSRTPRTLGKLTAAYHWRDGAHFDHDYYGDAHARLAIGLLAPLGLLRFESERAAAATLAALAADVPNQGLRPVLHVCEATVHVAA